MHSAVSPDWPLNRAPICGAFTPLLARHTISPSRSRIIAAPVAPVARQACSAISLSTISSASRPQLPPRNCRRCARKQRSQFPQIGFRTRTRTLQAGMFRTRDDTVSHVGGSVALPRILHRFPSSEQPERFLHGSRPLASPDQALFRVRADFRQRPRRLDAFDRFPKSAASTRKPHSRARKPDPSPIRNVRISSSCGHLQCFSNFFRSHPAASLKTPNSLPFLGLESEHAPRCRRFRIRWISRWRLLRRPRPSRHSRRQR